MSDTIHPENTTPSSNRLRMVLRDTQVAREQLEKFEFIYRRLCGDALACLQEQAPAYKQAVLSVQEIILPTIRKNCSACKPQCCQLDLPERQIYMQRTIGGFSTEDFLLARCDSDFPAPRYENAERNLCVFWEKGCRLPLDSRSLMCIQYFCDDIRQQLDDEKLKECIERIKSVIQDFSSEGFTQINPRYYHGMSMPGTFQLGDRLLVTPTPISNIRIGDVVLYRGTNTKGETEETVHRVVAIAPAGLITQGDGNPHRDTPPISTDNLIGLVKYAERDSKKFPVRGGRIALARVWLLRVEQWILQKTWYVITRAGYRMYGRLRSSGIVARLWHPRITRVALATQYGQVIKYVCNGQTVARWWQNTNHFECTKPYDLILRPPDLS